MYSYLKFNLDGKIRISERGEPSKSGGFDCNELIDEEHTVELEIGKTDDEDERDTTGIWIEICAYHAENQDSKRVFHPNLSVSLTKEQAESIHAYLGYLLSQP